MFNFFKNQEQDKDSFCQWEEKGREMDKHSMFINVMT